MSLTRVPRTRQQKRVDLVAFSAVGTAQVVFFAMLAAGVSAKDALLMTGAFAVAGNIAGWAVVEGRGTSGDRPHEETA